MLKKTGISSWAVLLLGAIFASSCSSYHQRPLHQRATFCANQNRKWKKATTTSLFIGADFDSDIEAALGQGSVSEYERDAEFYRKRNEAYYNSLGKSEDNEDVVSILSATNAASGHQTSNGELDPKPQKHQNPRWVTESINTSIKASQSSFRFVEKSTFSMLTQKPMVALAIFATAGMLVAYLSGFFFLEGYIENWNPVENDVIPYWDDAEIHTIERALPPPEA